MERILVESPFSWLLRDSQRNNEMKLKSNEQIKMTCLHLKYKTFHKACDLQIGKNMNSLLNLRFMIFHNDACTIPMCESIYFIRRITIWKLLFTTVRRHSIVCALFFLRCVGEGRAAFNRSVNSHGVGWTALNCHNKNRKL